MSKKIIIIKIKHDQGAESPREWDNLGTMVCFHRHYNLDEAKRGFRDADEVMQHIEETRAIALPLYLYDHSGITMRTSPFSCPWDSGQVGVIFVTREKILKEYGKKILTKSIRERIIKRLVQEVETYDDYLTGNAWGYVIEGEDGNHLDSCWGFLGDPKESGCLDDAWSTARGHQKEAQKKLKDLIRHRAPLEKREGLPEIELESEAA